MRFLLALLTLPAFAQVANLSSDWGVLSRAGDYSNSETQCYKPGNVSVSNGLLNITFKTETSTCGDSNHTATSHSYTSGNIYWTSKKFQYGTIEWKGKLSDRSSWFAIWMIGENCQATWGNTADNSGLCSWPASGSQEVDILELRPDKTTEGYNIFTGANYPPGNSCPGPTVDGNTHTWQYIWTATSSSWKRDGSTYCTTTATNDRMNTPMWMIVQIASRSGDSPTTPTTAQIDYIKWTASDGVTVYYYDDFNGLGSPRAAGGKGMVYGARAIR